jgi:uncharacterized alkaline shock family protein YloU
MAKRTAPSGAQRAKAPSREAPQGVSRPVAPNSPASDLIIAKAIATAVRMTPGVVDLSPGFLALAATYGPNERVVGVVVRHTAPHATAVEVHVTVAMEAATAIPTTEAQGGVSSVAAKLEPPESAVLTHVADHVREAVYRAMRDLHVATPSAVDVFIDDIQAPA